MSLPPATNLIAKLCAGFPETLAEMISLPLRKALLPCVAISAFCGACYGFSVGIWRAPTQGFYVAIKIPVLIILTGIGNAMINGMLAQVFGSKMSLKESFSAVMMSFTVASIILASISPLVLFAVLNCPSVSSAGESLSHNALIVLNVMAIAFAGTVSNLHLYRLVLHLTKSCRQSRQIIFSWLAVNLLLGSQLSWIMRPFIGAPTGEVEFMRENAMSGSFFEAVFHSMKSLF